jgi:hypothetical protein
MVEPVTTKGSGKRDDNADDGSDNDNNENDGMPEDNSLMA